MDEGLYFRGIRGDEIYFERGTILGTFFRGYCSAVSHGQTGRDKFGEVRKKEDEKD